MGEMTGYTGALGVVCVALAFLLGRAGARRRALALEAEAHRDAEAIKAASAFDAAGLRREAELGAREQALVARAASEAVFNDQETGHGRREAAQVGRAAELEARAAGIARRRVALGVAGEALAIREAEARSSREALAALGRARRDALERMAGETAQGLRQGLVDAEIEEARGQAGQLVRSAEGSVADPDQVRRAKRVLGIAIGRFEGHYLTERLVSVVPLGPPGANERIFGPEDSNLRAIEAVANVKLSATENRDAVRLEGLDGVGKEVARRCLALLARAGRPSDATNAFLDLARRLEQEIAGLGRRAFELLTIPRAHPDIVRLVGALNYRTSFAQNQWKHGIETGFLCGMMAHEMQLEVPLGRRAGLMHDIGKALTHELDGSHAVIGAEHARRLGETELVANAIGAHHTDEPFRSPYAFLVAAADALSGGRPGARRQLEENFVGRLADLERITRSFRGVGESYAVQGGREVRVQVQEDRVSDEQAAAMSGDIARKISEEMTFPGQIKVTVIREVHAVEVAH